MPAFERGWRNDAAVHHDQHQPGPQRLVGVGPGGREHPRKIGWIKINNREVVGLEVGDSGLGVGAHHQAWVDADHVARCVKREVNVA